MKRSLFCLVTLCILLSSLWCSSAKAVGLGAYVSAASGRGEVEYIDSEYGEPFDVDTSDVSFGFVLDTAPSDERVFNYRLNGGYAAGELEDESGATMETKGIYVDNIFGFALIKNKTLRWWLGPLVRVGYHTGEDKEDSNNEIEFAEVGVGAVTGINFSINDKVILAPSFGFRYSGNYGTNTYTYYGHELEEVADFEMTSTTAFVNFAVLF